MTLTTKTCNKHDEPLLCDLCDGEDADWVDEDHVFKVCPDCDAWNAGEWVAIP